VTRDVAELSDVEIEDALEAGADKARQLLTAGLIDGAALRLHGETVVVATREMLRAETAFHSNANRKRDACLENEADNDERSHS